MSIYGLTLSEITSVIQTFFIILGVILTVITLLNARSDSKKRATLELILHQRADKQLAWATRKMSELVKKQTEADDEYADLSQYLRQPSEERKAIATVLNHREFVAVGINSGIIHEQTYKQAYYSMFIRDWKYLANTVNTIRNSPTGNKTNFQDFETLARRWLKKPLKVK